MTKILIFLLLNCNSAFSSEPLLDEWRSILKKVKMINDKNLTKVNYETYCADCQSKLVESGEGRDDVAYFQPYNNNKSYNFPITVFSKSYINQFVQRFYKSVARHEQFWNNDDVPTWAKLELESKAFLASDHVIFGKIVIVAVDANGNEVRHDALIVKLNGENEANAVSGFGLDDIAVIDPTVYSQEGLGKGKSAAYLSNYPDYFKSATGLTIKSMFFSGPNNYNPEGMGVLPRKQMDIGAIKDMEKLIKMSDDNKMDPNYKPYVMREDNKT